MESTESKESDIRGEDIVSMLLTAAAYLISPILFIWSVNTLFGTAIAMGFKTWLAGFILIMLVKFHLKGSGCSFDSSDYDDDEMMREDDDVDEDAEEHRQHVRGKLIPYQDHKNKRKTPPDGTS